MPSWSTAPARPGARPRCACGATASRRWPGFRRRPARPGQGYRMRELLAQEMKAGAVGLSSGLEYDPGIFSARSEVLDLARVAAAAGGRYISHVRSEDRTFWDAIDEIVAIGREAKLPLQVSHVELAMHSLWGQADRLLRT